MLTEPTNSWRPPEPDLAPLVVGSAAARILYGLWSGCHSIEVVIGDHQERLVIAATIAAQLSKRAGVGVVIRVGHVGDRRPVLDLLTGLLPMSEIASPSFGTSWPADVHHWPNLALPEGVPIKGVTVAVGRQPIDRFHPICVLPEKPGYPPVEYKPWPGASPGLRVVRLSESDQGGTDTLADVPTTSLGDIPLDVVIAGAPEGPC